MPLHHPGPPPWLVLWARPGRLYAADGVTLKQICHFMTSAQVSPADGDKMQCFFICAGNETQLNFGSALGPNLGIFDLYVNDVLDSAGYDEYNAGTPNNYRWITLTQPIRSGKNIIELRVNGKNVLSTHYYLSVYGVSLQ